MMLNGFDGFCELYDQMAGDLGSYLLFNQELKLAGVSVRDAIEGIKLAQQLNQLKFERDGLLREEVQLKSEIDKTSNELEALKRQKNSVLRILEEGKATVWDEIAKKERIQECFLKLNSKENGLGIRKNSSFKKSVPDCR